MALKAVGVGLGRTGTNSLQVAIERLLGRPCYHGNGYFPSRAVRDKHGRLWHDAVLGKPMDWDRLFDGYAAAMDINVALFWRELADHFHDALFVLSVRPTEEWWASYDRTVLDFLYRGASKPTGPWMEMIDVLVRSRFTPDPLDKDAAIAAFERHNAEVKASLADRPLVVWTPGDGWRPICAALEVPVPDDPFPHVNVKRDFRAGAGLDDAS